jgi:cell wall-associated NlpC family hydrolase
MVEVVKTTEQEAYIKITQSYYLNGQSPEPQSHYWVLKKNITLFDDLEQHALDLHHVPAPIAFSDGDNCHNLIQENIVTLTQPHYDPTLKITFSAGTRFVQAPSKHKKKSVEVYAIDYQTYKEHRIKIPCTQCVFSNLPKEAPARITDYVNLLKQWAHIKKGYIPYTWGGTSFTYTVHNNFKEQAYKTNNSDYAFYSYENDKHCPKSGFDCSGVIARAAQICGIPYFCKNTSTIAQSLTPLQKEQVLAVGDLILIKGHVMVVSDLAKNLLIEARAYSHGYGKLHEIALKDVFADITTYDDLMNVYFNKQIVKRKDKKGNVRDTFTNLQLFSMASVIK